MLKDRQELRAFREECVRAYNAYKRKIPAQTSIFLLYAL